jgi:hypothetical protein
LPIADLKTAVVEQLIRTANTVQNTD